MKELQRTQLNVCLADKSSNTDVSGVSGALTVAGRYNSGESLASGMHGINQHAVDLVRDTEKVDKIRDCYMRGGDVQARGLVTPSNQMLGLDTVNTAPYMDTKKICDDTGMQPTHTSITPDGKANSLLDSAGVSMNLEGILDLETSRIGRQVLDSPKPLSNKFGGSSINHSAVPPSPGATVPGSVGALLSHIRNSKIHQIPSDVEGCAGSTEDAPPSSVSTGFMDLVGTSLDNGTAGTDEHDGHGPVVTELPTSVDDIATVKAVSSHELHSMCVSVALASPSSSTTDAADGLGEGAGKATVGEGRSVFQSTVECSGDGNSIRVPGGDGNSTGDTAVSITTNTTTLSDTPVALSVCTQQMDDISAASSSMTDVPMRRSTTTSDIGAGMDLSKECEVSSTTDPINEMELKVSAAQALAENICAQCADVPFGLMVRYFFYVL